MKCFGPGGINAEHCELLVLMKDDFKNVLQASVQKQWDEVQNAMSAFTYFDSLDAVARREGCIVAKMKTYEANETVLGDGVGVPNFVYFVLSGRCQMIESLEVFVETHLRKTFYTLHDPYVPVDESDQDFETKYFGNKKLSSGVKSHNSSDMGKSISEDLKKEPEKSILKPESTYAKRVSVYMTEDKQIERDPKEDTGTDILKPRVRERTQSVRISTTPITLGVLPSKKVRTYFMQVCIFNAGSTFGFGENMRDRRIVALTPVRCMLLPKIWLLQRNTANIWSRIQHYLEKKIPTKKQLFKEFVSARKWEAFREQIVEDVVTRASTVNWTTVHDVPYSIRMEEMLDI